MASTSCKGVKMRSYCQCGCGQIVNEGKKFIVGHNLRVISEESEKKRVKKLTGRILSKEIRNKISKGNKGKVQSQETRNKISATRLRRGIKNTEEAKKKMSETRKGMPGTFKGKHHSDETKKKISEAKLGRSNVALKGVSKTDDHRNKISKSLREYYKHHSGPMAGRFGPLNPKWKGGYKKCSDEYCSVWKDLEYKQDIRDRDGNKCQNPDCWHTADHLPLNIHHINYDKKNCHPWNLITLCFSCNSRANKDRDCWSEFYKDMSNKKYNYKEYA